MRLSIITVILLFSSFIIIQPVSSVPGESFTNAIPAVLGQNNGTLVTASVFYNFTGISGKYNISLIGPENTDFDFRVFDNNQNIINTALETYYPDSLIVDNPTFPIIIEVYAIVGNGNFTLLIEEYTGNNTTPRQQIAKLGDNYGEFLVTNDFIRYDFLGISGRNYRFNLSGASNMNFYMYIQDRFGNYFDGDGGNPAVTKVFNAPSEIVIHVYPYDNIGQFKLNVEDFQGVPGDHPSIPYNISIGDTTFETENDDVYFKFQADNNDYLFKSNRYFSIYIFEGNNLIPIGDVEYGPDDYTFFIYNQGAAEVIIHVHNDYWYQDSIQFNTSLYQSILGDSVYNPIVLNEGLITESFNQFGINYYLIPEFSNFNISIDGEQGFYDIHMWYRDGSYWDSINHFDYSLPYEETFYSLEGPVLLKISGPGYDYYGNQAEFTIKLHELPGIVSFDYANFNRGDLIEWNYVFADSEIGTSTFIERVTVEVLEDQPRYMVNGENELFLITEHGTIGGRNRQIETISQNGMFYILPLNGRFSDDTYSPYTELPIFDLNMIIEIDDGGVYMDNTYCLEDTCVINFSGDQWRGSEVGHISGNLEIDRNTGVTVSYRIHTSFDDGYWWTVEVDLLTSLDNIPNIYAIPDDNNIAPSSSEEGSFLFFGEIWSISVILISFTRIQRFIETKNQKKRK
ncbi:MAG: hypothetical protein OEZ01_15415 [Candidatus Heimdallarchaeota archaeon]|nr:hypothetical protein [Candidatus Heimdallarchaeota archaeon]MDH5647398.1 hypothetical protein [Candidatus Heimdallarchaeota archaeon]